MVRNSKDTIKAQLEKSGVLDVLRSKLKAEIIRIQTVNNIVTPSVHTPIEKEHLIVLEYLKHKEFDTTIDALLYDLGISNLGNTLEEETLKLRSSLGTSQNELLLVSLLKNVNWKIEASDKILTLPVKEEADPPNLPKHQTHDKNLVEIAEVGDESSFGFSEDETLQKANKSAASLSNYEDDFE